MGLVLEQPLRGSGGFIIVTSLGGGFDGTESTEKVPELGLVVSLLYNPRLEMYQTGTEIAPHVPRTTTWGLPSRSSSMARHSCAALILS